MYIDNHIQAGHEPTAFKLSTLSQHQQPPPNVVMRRAAGLNQAPLCKLQSKPLCQFLKVFQVS
jgi:hypothetical protein